ncbi:riboflavin synthase [Bartonella tamiae]|uniref:Riboflavin synthase n=1 Tax=Bartonella tamiae Th239 TaxID=1094558 RepID=J1JV51_9HYPH|nr:riboflavin synthase [Bartonella tamiae]EJF88852.1 riboflavin synthase, alpha subunit [Bartonella tamiae Th239]EJF94898.1 riboflavin synthase, alpha subunit [Bartonella tamiae Th307]
MFTGIITDIGTVESVVSLNEGKRIQVKTHYDADTIEIGASIACAGICLTVVETDKYDENLSFFIVEAWEEAMRLTTIDHWTQGTKINLERSLKLGDEMGGHLVSGHVDGLAKIIETQHEGDAKRFRLQVPKELSPFIARKGSVSLNGTSLTVNEVCDDIFDILIIRHTLKVTTWGTSCEGDFVNIEIDQLARYAARLSGYKE